MSARVLQALAGLALSLAGAAHGATVTAFATQLPQTLYGLTTDGNALYYSGANGLLRDFSVDISNGVIGRIALSGGAATTLYSLTNYVSASGHVAPMQLAVDGAGDLVWADPDAGSSTGAAFLRGAVAGGTPSKFFDICCGASVLPGDSIGVAFDAAGRIVFSDGTGGRLGVDPSGSSATQIGPARFGALFETESFSQIAVANGKIFIADSALQFGAGSNHKAAIFDRSATIVPGVRWISLDGSSGFVDLSVGKLSNPRGIVAVGKFIYVTDAHAVWKIDQVTGVAKKFAQDKRFQDLQGITFAKGAFYVADSQTKYGTPVGIETEAVKDGPGKIWKIVP